MDGGGYRNMKWRWSEGIDYYCVIAAVIDDGGVSSRRETPSRKGGKECVLPSRCCSKLHSISSIRSDFPIKDVEKYLL